MSAHETPAAHRPVDQTRRFQMPRVPTQLQKLTGAALTCAPERCFEDDTDARSKSVLDCLRHGDNAITILRTFTANRLVNLIEKSGVASEPDGLAEAAAGLIACRVDHTLVAAHRPGCADRDVAVCDTDNCPRSAGPVCRADRTQSSCVAWRLRPTVAALQDVDWPTAPAIDQLPQPALCANGYALAPIMAAVVDSIVAGRTQQVLDAAAAASPEAHAEATWILQALLVQTKPGYFRSSAASAEIDRFRREGPSPLGQRPERYGRNSRTGRAVCPDDIDAALLGRLGAAASQGRFEVALHTTRTGGTFDDAGALVQAADAYLRPLQDVDVVPGDGTAVGVDLGDYLLHQARRRAKDKNPELALKLSLITDREAASRVHDCLVRLRELDPRSYEELAALRQALGTGLQMVEISYQKMDLDQDAFAGTTGAIDPRQPVTRAEQTWLTRCLLQVQRTLTGDPTRNLTRAVTQALGLPGTPQRWRNADGDPVVLNDLLTHLARTRETGR